MKINTEVQNTADCKNSHPQTWTTLLPHGKIIPGMKKHRQGICICRTRIGFCFY